MYHIYIDLVVRNTESYGLKFSEMPLTQIYCKVIHNSYIRILTIQSCTMKLQVEIAIRQNSY